MFITFDGRENVKKQTNKLFWLQQIFKKCFISFRNNYAQTPAYGETLFLLIFIHILPFIPPNSSFHYTFMKVQIQKDVLKESMSVRFYLVPIAFSFRLLLAQTSISSFPRGFTRLFLATGLDTRFADFCTFLEIQVALNCRTRIVLAACCALIRWRSRLCCTRTSIARICRLKMASMRERYGTDSASIEFISFMSEKYSL